MNELGASRFEAALPSDPDRLGPYRIVGRLGRGGMGTVYLAEAPTGGQVALKVINEDLAAEPSFANRFRAEVRAAQRVRRFCTAPVLDARMEGEPLYVVTEYVPGPDLAKAVKQWGRLEGSNLEALAVGVATALTAIHGAGVVHRDLKPSNVVLSPLGPRVIDFGIARALDSLGEGTATGQILGTPEYMAPELLMGGDLSPASDVFSWGCVVCFAGTGRSPFAGRTVPQVLYRIVHDAPELGDLDPGLRALVEQALSKDPAQRPSAQDLLNRLVGRADADTATVSQTLRLDWPTTAPPTAAAVAQAPPATRPKGWKGRGAIISGVLAVVVAVSALGVVVWRAMNDSPPKPAETVFADDFAAKDGDWPTSWAGVDTTHGYTGDGRYTLSTWRLEQVRFATAPVNARLPAATMLTVKAQLTAGKPDGAFGFFCHSDDKDHSWYELSLRRDSQVLIRKVAKGTGRELTAAVPVAGLQPDKGVHLQAACVKEDNRTVRLSLWINGERAAEVVDGDRPLKSGRVGLLARQPDSGDVGTRVYFDDFEVSRI